MAAQRHFSDATFEWEKNEDSEDDLKTLIIDFLKKLTYHLKLLRQVCFIPL